MNQEAKIEKLLVRKIKEAGGVSWKFASPGTAGVPDRLVLLKCKVCFVELKAPGQKPRALQRERAREIRKEGAHVYCISTKEQVLRFVREMKRQAYPKESDYDDI